MSKKSLTLAEKLNLRFQPDPTVMEAMSLLSHSLSPARFHSPQELKNHLSEGALLNVSVIGSRALSVPQGEYMVWLTDAGHTMLVPTTEKRGSGEVFEQSLDGYEVQTRDLLQNWNRLERVLAEGNEVPGQQNLQQGGNQENIEQPEGETGDPDEGKAGEFQSTIDVSTVDRTPIMRAMQDRGFTVTSLAAECGVDPPAISRILRTPKDTQGDPGGRNPSMGLASQICNTLRIDPTAAFPDIFSPNEKYQPRQQQGNDGSGSQGGTKGGVPVGESVGWDSGSIEEDPDFFVEAALQSSAIILEATQTYMTVCEHAANHGLDYSEFWNDIFIPAIRNTTPRSTIATLTENMLQNIKGFMGRTAPMRPVQTDKTHPKGGTMYGNEFKPDPKRVRERAEKMTQMLVPGIKGEFKTFLQRFRKDLQRKILDQAHGPDAGNPKMPGTIAFMAPHAFKLVDDLCLNVLRAANDYKPKWEARPADVGNPYDSEYNAAKKAFASNNPDATLPYADMSDEDEEAYENQLRSRQTMPDMNLPTSKAPTSNAEASPFEYQDEGGKWVPVPGATRRPSTQDQMKAWMQSRKNAKPVSNDPLDYGDPNALPQVQMPVTGRM